MLLFLDSVDQLTGAQDANKVSWLPTRLPPYCKVSNTTKNNPLPFSNITNSNLNVSQIIISCACEGETPDVTKEYHILRRMIDVEENFVEVTALGEDLAMRVIK